jgi:hypothetical protein
MDDAVGLARRRLVFLSIVLLLGLCSALGVYYLFQLLL